MCLHEEDVTALPVVQSPLTRPCFSGIIPHPAATHARAGRSVRSGAKAPSQTPRPARTHAATGAASFRESIRALHYRTDKNGQCTLRLSDRCPQTRRTPQPERWRAEGVSGDDLDASLSTRSVFGRPLKFQISSAVLRLDSSRFQAGRAVLATRSTHVQHVLGKEEISAPVAVHSPHVRAAITLGFHISPPLPADLHIRRFRGSPASSQRPLPRIRARCLEARSAFPPLSRCDGTLARA